MWLVWLSRCVWRELTWTYLKKRLLNKETPITGFGVGWQSAPNASSFPAPLDTPMQFICGSKLVAVEIGCLINVNTKNDPQFVPANVEHPARQLLERPPSASRDLSWASCRCTMIAIRNSPKQLFYPRTNHQWPIVFGYKVMPSYKFYKIMNYSFNPWPNPS